MTDRIIPGYTYPFYQPSIDAPLRERLVGAVLPYYKGDNIDGLIKYCEALEQYIKGDKHGGNNGVGPAYARIA